MNTVEYNCPSYSMKRISQNFGLIDLITVTDQIIQNISSLLTNILITLFAIS